MAGTPAVASSTPLLVEVLRSLANQHRAICEQAWEAQERAFNADDDVPDEEGQSLWEAATGDAPLFWFCARLEELCGISQYELETAAHRLTTAIGLKLHRKRKRPGEEPEGWPDWLWMFERFNALDANGTTAHLLAELVDRFAGELPTELRRPGAVPVRRANARAPEGPALERALAMIEEAHRQILHRLEAQLKPLLGELGERIGTLAGTIENAAIMSPHAPARDQEGDDWSAWRPAIELRVEKTSYNHKWL